MEALQQYFGLFDESRTSEDAREALHALFTDEMVFVLNGYEQQGIEKWRAFVQKIYENNVDLKHMHEGWQAAGDGMYETRWAVCGKLATGQVYTQTGVDRARLTEDGKIAFLENVPDEKTMFTSYKN